MKKNINLSPLFLCILLLLNYSCKNEESYRLDKLYNEGKRYSTVYLYHENIKVDSIRLFDYYNDLQIKKNGSNRWFIYYKGRGGSRVSTGNSLLINVINTKINIPLFVNSMNRSYESERVFIKDSLALQLKNNALTIISLQAKNEQVVTSKTMSVDYDEKQHLFYNGKAVLKKGSQVSSFDFNDMEFKVSKVQKNGEYPSLKIENTTYVHYNNTWYWIKNENEMISLL